ncbi:hypothetical protein FA95DRAFT_1207281 [Auriscalpium vulgare]|uniref:Uncharacterized protein n=1 Tax=Auriscalpium vulgare TaxID=40419 RepID=A0ACB8RTQ1_9AGAM|nr:hypothetical protein FA95DRAFT_1207281 [Auriscalpium vulgare]
MLEPLAHQATSPEGESEIQRNLRKHPADVIKRAKAGSVVAVRAISQTCRSMRTLQTREVVDIMCSHVSISKIPHPFDNSSPTSFSALSCALWSFSAMHELTDVSPESTLSSVKAARFTEQIAGSWDGIYHWAAFFNELYPRISPEEQRDVHQIITRTLFYFGRHASSQRALADLPATIELTASYWEILDLIASYWIKEPRYSATGQSHSYASALAGLLLSEGDATHIQRFVDAAGGSPSCIARVALSHLHAALKKPDATSWTLNVHLQLLYLLACDDALRSAIVEQCGVSVVTRAIVTLVKTRDHAIEETRSFLDLAFMLLARIVVTGTGIRWVQIAMHEGILHAYSSLFPALKYYDRDEMRPITHLISRVLPAYLVYRLPLKATVAALHAQNTVITSKVGESAVGGAWLRMVKLAKIHADLKDSAMRTICSHCHMASVDKTAFKRCARCKSVAYCSESCQAAGWDTHKVDCSVSQLYLIRDDLPTRRDRTFLERIALHDVCNRSAHLRSLTAKRYPGVPLSRVVITLDYRHLPSLDTYVIDASNIGNRIAPTEDPKMKELMESIARRSGQGTTLIECVTKLGERTLISLALVTPSIWDPSSDHLTEFDFYVTASAVAEMALPKEGSNVRSG